MEGLLESTAREVLEFTTEAVFSERYARKSGLLQQADPRVKLLSLLILVTVVVSLRNIYVILFFYTVPLIFALLSHIRVSYFIKRVWFFIPVFTGLIAVPSIFMIPGRPVFTLPFTEWSASWEGLTWAALFTLRVATAVSYAILFTMTTRWKDFVSALTSLRVPGAVITITTLAYRYIFLLAKLLLDSMHARRSRLAGNLGLVESWKEAGKHMGATFIKANSLGEEVYYAMLARGYSNDTLRSEELKIGKTDYALAVFTLILLALAVVTTEVFR